MDITMDRRAKIRTEWTLSIRRMYVAPLTEEVHRVLPAAAFASSRSEQTVVDLGMSPLCESYLSASSDQPDGAILPFACARLRTLFPRPTRGVCESGEISSTDYAYFSSYSDTWLAHAKAYAEQMTDRFHLNPNSLVVEVASNDGYLLQYFVAKHIPVLGIEPAANVAAVASRN